MIDTREYPGGVIIMVTVRTKGGRNAVVGMHGDALKVSVTKAPEKGKANRAVIDLLAKFFQVAKNRIELASGETSRDKTFRIEGMGKDEIRARLESEGLI